MVTNFGVFPACDRVKVILPQLSLVLVAVVFLKRAATLN